MKTTLEIPDALFRRAMAAAAEQGIAFHQLVSDALAEKLRRSDQGAKAWMASFGKLKGLHSETERLNRLIEGEFEAIEAEDRA
ncbi:MAG: hypothetical protein U0R19_27380 [Bryobacteraceae bacterium]